MKKFSKILAALLTVVLCAGINFASAQVIFSQDFSKITKTGSQQCSTSSSVMDIRDSLPGWESERLYPAGGKVKLSTGSVAGWIKTPAIDLSGNSGNFVLSFDAKAWYAASENQKIWVFVDNDSTLVEGVTIGSSNSDCNLVHFSLNMTGGTDSSRIMFKGFAATNSRFFLDNIVITDGTEVALNVSPSAVSMNNVILGTSGNATINVSGRNLDATLSTTVTLAGSSAFTTTSTAIANADILAEDGADLVITYTPTQTGNDTAVVTLTNNQLEEPVTVTVIGRCIAASREISTIAELRTLYDWSNASANTTDTIIYKYVGHAIITEAFEEGSSNESFNKWMQDSTGAIQLYDPSHVLTNLSVGCEITNVFGKLSNYYGYLEFEAQTAIAPTDINAFPTWTVTPLDITTAQLNDVEYMHSIQAQLVRLSNVTFDATGNFQSYYLYTVNGGDTAVCFTASCTLHGLGAIPTGATTVVGVNVFTKSYYAGYDAGRVSYPRYYVRPQSVGGSIGIAENEMANVNVYPNPAEGNVTLSVDTEVSHVAIYNVMGSQVASQSIATGNNVIGMENLTPGVYFLRIFNGNQLVGTTKVIRK